MGDAGDPAATGYGRSPVAGHFSLLHQVALDLPCSLVKAWLGLAAASAPGSCQFYEAEVFHVRHKAGPHSFR